MAENMNTTTQNNASEMKTSTPVVTSPITPGEDEVCNFDADIQQLMNLIINSFYSNNDIFLRELISNASDAIDKIRYQSLTDKTVLEHEPSLEIRLTADAEKGVLIVEDTGIGMTNSDLKNNLGTIARSGTKNFLQAAQSSKDLSMIGQFGVGFYSAFLVADKVEVVTKNNEDVEQVWTSSGGSNFIISHSESSNLKRGTQIRLHLKEDHKKYLEESTLKNIVKTHSEFISYPIKLWCQKSREVEVDLTEEELEEAKKKALEEKQQQKTDETAVTEELETATEDSPTEENKSGEEAATGEEENSAQDDDVTVEEIEEEEVDVPKTKKVQEKYHEWDVLNSQKPIWTQKPEDISEEEYTSFYKTVSNDWEEPLAHKHFSIEGSISVKGIIFIPKRAPFDLYQKSDKKSKVKLYVRRVFITDDCEELMPEYFGFVAGVVDSEDLPLNVSRELLQQNRVLKQIRKTLVKKTIELLMEIKEDPEKYKIFYKNFSKSIKLSVYEDSKNQAKLSKLLMFSTSKSEEMRSLDQYVDDMPEGQPGIYYISGESKEIVKNSPFVERLHKKGWEVLYFVDALDEYMTQKLTEFRDKKLMCITKSDLDLGDTEEEKKELEEMKQVQEGFCKQIKEILGDKVEKVVISNRVAKSPCCLVSGQFGWTANMERIMKAQALGENRNMQFMMSKKTFEINPTHKLVKALKQRFDTDPHSIKDMVWLLYESSVLDSGFSLDNPSSFTQRIHRILSLGLSVDDDEEEVEGEEELPDLEVDASDGDEDGDMEQVD